MADETGYLSCLVSCCSYAHAHLQTHLYLFWQAQLMNKRCEITKSSTYINSHQTRIESNITTTKTNMKKKRNITHLLAFIHSTSTSSTCITAILFYFRSVLSVLFMRNTYNGIWVKVKGESDYYVEEMLRQVSIFLRD